ncbi:MAG TPA: hypothetical protein VGJ20_34260 [Xanthobacteraceae bacterium]
MSLFAPPRHDVATLVSPSTQHHAITAPRHRALIAPRLLGGAAGLALYLLSTCGAPSASDRAALASLVAPMLLAGLLSRAGGYESAQMLASPAPTVLPTMACFATIWLTVGPLEASLSANRKRPLLRHLPLRAYSTAARQTPPPGAGTPVNNSG